MGWIRSPRKSRSVSLRSAALGCQHAHEEAAPAQSSPRDRPERVCPECLSSKLLPASSSDEPAAQPSRPVSWAGPSAADPFGSLAEADSQSEGLDIANCIADRSITPSAGNERDFRGQSEQEEEASDESQPLHSGGRPVIPGNKRKTQTQRLWAKYGETSTV